MLSCARTILLLLCAAVALATCGGDRDPIRQTLDRLEEAAESRDVAFFEEALSSEYRDPSGLTRTDAMQMLRRYFSAYEKIELAISDVETSRNDRAATARFAVRVIGTPRAIGGLDSWLPRNSSWRFELRFAPEGGEWKIYWASWTRQEDAAGG